MVTQINSAINTLINSVPILRSYISKISELEVLNDIVQKVLDAKTKQHCVVANLNNDTVILSTTSPAWKHKIRFVQFEILQTLQNMPRFSHITNIKICVDVINCNELIKNCSNQLLEKPSISLQNAQIITDIIEDIKSEKLAKALKRLANRAKQEST